MTLASKQYTALFFIALICLDGPGAMAARVNQGEKSQSQDVQQGGEASFSQGTVEAANQERLDETGLYNSDSDGNNDEDEDEEAVFKYEQLKDPHKPIASKYRNGKGIRDAFSRLTGLVGKEAKDYYAEAVRKVIPDEYIAEASQFALCARISSSASEEKDSSIGLRCTPAMNLLPSVTEKDTSGRFNFKDVWKALRDVVDEVKVPNINWSNHAFSNTWRSMTNWATGKKDRFLREQAKLDERFKDYFGVQAKASALSFLKESIPVDDSEVQKLMSFDSAVGSTTVSMTSAMKRAWPAENQPSMGSRYVLCFGRLSQRGKKEVDPQAMDKHCTGFWNKHMAKDAIVGLGKSLQSDDTWLFRDETLYQTRMEILYGSGSQDAQASAFNLAGRSQSSKSLARTIAKLVRERVSAEGLECEPCAAAALGIKGPDGSGGQSLMQTNATGNTSVCPWLYVGSGAKEGVMHLTLTDGVITSSTAGGAGVTGATTSGVMIGGVAFPPALIIVGIIVILYILKNVAVAARKYYLTKKKLKKWQTLLADKAGTRQGCFVSSSQATKAISRRCPRN